MKKSIQQRIDEAKANLRRDLGAYQEAFWCLRAGKTPVAFQSGEDDSRVTVELLGADRASGGVIIFGPSAVYATDWLESARNSPDPYMRDLAHQVEREQARACRRPAALH